MDNTKGRIYVPENADEIEVVRNQVYTRRDALGLGGKVLLALFAGCAMPPGMRRVMTQEQWKGLPLGKRLKYAIGNYGAIDDYIKVLLEEGDIGTAAQGVLLYPADFVLDLARSVGMAVVDVPKEAWKRTEAKAGKNVKSKGDSSITDILYAPIEVAGNATNFTWEYLALSVDGTIKHIAKYPFESAAHGFTGWYVGRLIYDANKSHHHKGAVGEAKPPMPPFQGPPGAPFP